MEDAAVLHGLRALHSWLHFARGSVATHDCINMRAGTVGVTQVLSSCFDMGVLQLRTVAASPLAADIDRVERWLRVDIWLRPFEPTTALGDAQRITWRSKEILRIANDFRARALPRLGERWGATLPLIPLTHEVRVELPKPQQQKDEHMARRRLGELESASAAIIVILEVTWGLSNEALFKLRLRIREKVNLLGISRGTRYEYYYKGTLLPSWCPNKHHGQICGRADPW